MIDKNYNFKQIDPLLTMATADDISYISTQGNYKNGFSNHLVAITSDFPSKMLGNSLDSLKYDLFFSESPVSSRQFGWPYRCGVSDSDLDSVVLSASKYFGSESKVIITHSNRNKFDVIIPKQTLKNFSSL